MQALFLNMVKCFFVLSGISMLVIGSCSQTLAILLVETLEPKLQVLLQFEIYDKCTVVLRKLWNHYHHYRIRHDLCRHHIDEALHFKCHADWSCSDVSMDPTENGLVFMAAAPEFAATLEDFLSHR